MGRLWAVVLAAGEGKRMHSDLPKVLHPVCGRPMLAYVLDSAAAVADEVVVVIGHGAARVRQAAGAGLRFVEQREQLGTGHAVLQALPHLPDEGTLLVLCGDTPLLEAAELERLVAAHGGNAATISTAFPPDPDGYGRVVRDESGSLVRIVEESDASPEEKKTREVNAGTYCFNLALLKKYLPLLTNTNAQKEYYLPDLPAILRAEGHPVATYRIADYRAALGVNDCCQLAEAAAVWRERINRALMRQGVSIVDPANTYIDYGVAIGSGTVIAPGCVIEGKTVIGSSCLIGPGAHLKDMELHGQVVLRHSVAEESVIESGAVIGPYAYIRPGCRIRSRAKIGDFVEVKNSAIGAGTKVPHLSYVGDAEIGDGVNLGAGVIIVNYDGRRKHRTVIGPGAFIGCNSNLVSPVEIGNGAYVAAGSTVTQNVPPDALALARARQENKPGLAGRLLKKDAARQEKVDRGEKE